MTYPQPSGAASVVAYEDVYRLFTPITSPGDIYELDVSASAFLIGPLADIAQVQITSFDPTERDVFSSVAVITPDRSMVQPTLARIDTVYPKSGAKKGRILISPRDLFNPYYRPVGYNNANDRIHVIQPRMDVMAYYSTPPSLVAQRSDRRFSAQYIDPPTGVGDDSWVLVPYYGRKYAHINIKNGTAFDVTLEIRGVNFTMQKGVLTPSLSGEETILSASAATAAAAYRNVIVRASVDGMFDYLALKYQPSNAAQVATFGPIPTRIMTSDDPL